MRAPGRLSSRFLAAPLAAVLVLSGLPLPPSLPHVAVHWWPRIALAAGTGVTTRASVDSAGAQANADSREFISISGDGRYVAFDSTATNLVAGDTNGVRDVFVRDRQAGTTRRVSVRSDGAQATGASSGPSVSADGRFVSFTSSASSHIASILPMR